MQWYSSSERKIYQDQRNCRDCQLTMMTSSLTDECGGIEVADGSSSDGNQYWYIMKPTFPYTIQVSRSKVDGHWPARPKVNGQDR